MLADILKSDLMKHRTQCSSRKVIFFQHKSYKNTRNSIATLQTASASGLLNDTLISWKWPLIFKSFRTLIFRWLRMAEMISHPLHVDTGCSWQLFYRLHPLNKKYNLLRSFPFSWFEEKKLRKHTGQLWTEENPHIHQWLSRSHG